MVKPGGTGRPALVISARPAPLPPRTSFILPLPSALPAPKKYTYFTSLLGVVTATSLSGRVVVAMISPLLYLFRFLTFGHDLGEVRDRRELMEQGPQKSEAVRPNPRVCDHHHHSVEERVDCGTQL